jgi:hypothetical protein
MQHTFIYIKILVSKKPEKLRITRLDKLIFVYQLPA